MKTANDSGVKDSRGLGGLGLGCGFWNCALARDGGAQALMVDGWAVSTDRPTKPWLDHWLAGNAGGLAPAPLLCARCRRQ